MIKGFKIVIEVDGVVKVLSKRDFDFYCKRNIKIKILGTLNQDNTTKLTCKQINILQKTVFDNIHYLANKNPETFIKNFNDSVIKELKQ